MQIPRHSISTPRVGIITFHHVHNSGAVLQAWSMMRILQDLGCSVEIIDYRPKSLDIKHKRKGIKAFYPSLGRLIFRLFIKTNFPLTPTFRTHVDVTKYVVNKGLYDYLICGSDQIWLKDRFLGFDSTYFLDFDDSAATRRVSYAPSCGNMIDFGEHSAEVARLLSKFRAISVRDKNTMSILNSLGITNATLVADPTLLANFDSVIKPLQTNRQYLVVAGETDSVSCVFIKKIARQLNLDIIALSRCAAADIEKRFISPLEWARYIAGAKYVVTSLFHATALAIKFRKPFVALGTQGRSFKIIDMLERFGLEERYCRPQRGRYELTPELLELNYGNANKAISELSKISIEFLRGALYGENRASNF